MFVHSLSLSVSVVFVRTASTHRLFLATMMMRRRRKSCTTTRRPCFLCILATTLLVLAAFLQQQQHQQMHQQKQVDLGKQGGRVSSTLFVGAAAWSSTSTRSTSKTTILLASRQTSRKAIFAQTTQNKHTQHKRRVLSSLTTARRDPFSQLPLQPFVPVTTTKTSLFLASSSSTSKNNERPPKENDDDDDDASSSSSSTASYAQGADTSTSKISRSATRRSRRYRAHFAGASVQADQGFFIILRIPIPQQNNSSDDNDNADDSEGNSSQQQQQLEPSSASSSSLTSSSTAVASMTLNNYFLPIYVCDDPSDYTVATSPEALTLLQLFSNVDMAGSVLPPNILERIVILSLEQDSDDDDDDDVDDDDMENSSIEQERPVLKRTRTLEEESLVQSVHEQIFDLQRQYQQRQQQSRSSSVGDNSNSNHEATLYSDCPSWLQSRVRLPVCTLEEIVVDITTTTTTAKKNCTASSPDSSISTATLSDVASSSSSSRLMLEFGLQVTARDFGTFFLESSLSSSSSSSDRNSVVPCVSYTYRPQTSRAFLATALALRYKCPVFVSIPSSSSSQSLLLTRQELQRRFPLYRSVSTLQERSNNVVSSIKRGFEVNQLQAAYQIAIRRNDEAAQVKIRAKLDEMDNMSELPTQADSDTASMQ
jgi:hypothetical protein